MIAKRLRQLPCTQPRRAGLGSLHVTARNVAELEQLVGALAPSERTTQASIDQRANARQARPDHEELCYRQSFGEPHQGRRVGPYLLCFGIRDYERFRSLCSRLLRGCVAGHERYQAESVQPFDDACERQAEAVRGVDQ
jgi:hypothetical protein